MKRLGSCVVVGCLLLLSATVASCGNNSRGQALAGAPAECHSLALCQEEMSGQAKKSVMVPHEAGLVVRFGVARGLHSRPGLVGEVYFSRTSPLAGFEVYQATAGLESCGQGTSTQATTPGGRSVCWTHDSNGFFSTKFVANGLLYQAYSSDAILGRNGSQPMESRKWALHLVDTYS